MINLLPTGIREDLLYARRNTVLSRWVVACSFALLGIGLIVAGGYVYLDQSSKTYVKRVEIAQRNLQSQNVEETQKKVEEISNNTKLATQVLSREILFSKLLRQLGSSLPENTILKQLQIDKLQGGLTLQAGAKDISGGAQLQLNLQDPKNKIFDKADIENITCVPPDPKIAYPCTVQIRALFTKSNPYLYIAPTAEGAKP